MHYDIQPGRKLCPGECSSMKQEKVSKKSLEWYYNKLNDGKYSINKNALLQLICDERN